MEEKAGNFKKSKKIKKGVDKKEEGWYSNQAVSHGDAASKRKRLLREEKLEKKLKKLLTNRKSCGKLRKLSPRDAKAKRSEKQQSVYLVN